MDEKFIKGIGIQKKMEMLERKGWINQIKNMAKSITNAVDWAEERISGIEEKVKEILHSDHSKEKINKHDHNFKNSGTWLRGQT
jgi:hypothetical protein